MNNSNPSTKICFIAASEMTIKAFLLEHLKTLSRTYDISVAVTTGNEGCLDKYGLDVRVIPVNIERKIAPIADIITLASLIRLFRREQFKIIHSITPKAGLLAMLAGVLTRVPIRIHSFVGQVWVTKKGFMRWFLQLADKITALCANHVLSDSQTQRQFLIDNKILPAGKIRVLANGSVGGVDTGRFKPDKEARKEIRDKLGLEESDFLILFMGRFTIDKGVLDLSEAFAHAFAGDSNVHLLFVGPDEEQLQDKIQELCPNTDRIHFIAYFSDIPEKWMAAADLLCLPSYRESFGDIIIEAAACGIPSLASRIYGITDVIVEGQTGLMHEAGNKNQIAELMYEMYKSGEKLYDMGRKARDRAIRLYSKEILTAAWQDYYRSVQ
jgi:glycosyltransferase involved in cell wall biosynthesis